MLFLSFHCRREAGGNSQPKASSAAGMKKGLTHCPHRIGPQINSKVMIVVVDFAFMAE